MSNRNKKLKYIVISVLLIMAVVLIVVLKKTTKTVTIKSNDGLATLEVSRTALPEGIKMSDIKITAVEFVQAGPEDEGSSPQAMYNFEPDGLVFNEPVNLTITVPTQERGSLLVRLGQDDFGIIEESVTSFSSDEKKVSVSGKVDHFTNYAIVDHLFQLTGPSEFGKVEVGNTFNVAVDVFYQREAVYTVQYRGSEDIEIYTLELTNDPHISGVSTSSKRLTPKMVESPEGQTITSGSHHSEASFACEEEGLMSINSSYFLTYRTRISFFIKGGEEFPPREQFGHESINFRGTGECVEEPSEQIEALVIEGAYYPKGQFRIAAPDLCDKAHYHANGTVFGLASKTSTDIVSAIDQFPRGCGFGKVDEVTVEWIDVTSEQLAALGGSIIE